MPFLLVFAVYVLPLNLNVSFLFLIGVKKGRNYIKGVFKRKNRVKGYINMNKLAEIIYLDVEENKDFEAIINKVLETCFENENIINQNLKT